MSKAGQYTDWVVCHSLTSYKINLFFFCGSFWRGNHSIPKVKGYDQGAREPKHTEGLHELNNYFYKIN